MLIALPIVLTVTILKLVSIETPVPDNRRTSYCVAETKYSKGEIEISAKKPCTRGSMSINKDLPGLAERKSK